MKKLAKTAKTQKKEIHFHLPPFKMEKVFLAMSQTTDWGLESLNVPNVWRATKGEGIKVAVLDTGVAYNHPDLSGAILDMKDFTNSPSGPYDIQNHGTHVAGVIAARDNTTGVVGVAPQAGLLIAKVLGDNGSGGEAGIIRGVEWALEKDADIISMSLGSAYETPELRKILNEAIKKGKFVICAAGNDGPQLDSVTYPGKYEEIITVGSIDRRRNISWFSSKGRQVDIVAPGDEILSTIPSNGYGQMSGTSMATPFVTGLAALMLAKHRMNDGDNKTPLKTQKQLMAHLKKMTIDLGPKGFDISYGYGLIDPSQLLNLDKSMIQYFSLGKAKSKSCNNLQN